VPKAKSHYKRNSILITIFFRVSTVQTHHNEFQRLQLRGGRKEREMGGGGGGGGGEEEEEEDEKEEEGKKATENAKTSQVVS
jgi:hypothetical protein